MKFRLQSKDRFAAHPSQDVRAQAIHARAHQAKSDSFRQLKQKVLQARLTAVDSMIHAVQIRWAAEEAAALSWTTGHPLLMFPSLFEEFADAAIGRARRQEVIHQRSRELLGLPTPPTAEPA